MHIKIIVAGPRGRMGSEAVNMINEEPNFQLVACIDRKNNGKYLSDIDSMPNLKVPIFEDAEECFTSIEADVLVDLTVPSVGFNHTKLAIEHKVRPVVGTSGFTDKQIKELTHLAADKEVGCIIAPNFAIGAVLMMQFVQMASKFLPDIEIIEKHHDQKLDAPSGTAMKTVDLISKVRPVKNQGHPEEVETLEGARGAEKHGIRVHSIRLPGLVAHQEVILGGQGQTLTIQHDSFNRSSFMSGVKLAVEHVLSIHTLIYGLENILDLEN